MIPTYPLMVQLLSSRCSLCSCNSHKQKTNPRREALNVALSVLTKSSAALLLLKSYLSSVPKHWRVLSIPYTGADDTDYDDIFGDTLPFENGIKAWIFSEIENVWYVIYKAEGVLVFFLFFVTENTNAFNFILQKFQDANKFLFEGNHLNQLIEYKWKEI